ncbi:hypothetical protein BV582_20855 [Bacillus paralicheniformis]|uniref:hypothetical protein n=1 Tax=Bacillus paralicheniformis TaxID=1648923 RepID=UPI000CB1DAC7|nr:hypothetical protein [Bacillus paralicheniformis]PLC14025.1 hypothetical protein BV582_20855 [Bacillus paralicheniformis]
MTSQLSDLDVSLKINEYLNEVGTPFKIKELIIDGDKVINGWYIRAEKIIFKSGSSIWFSEAAQQRRTNFYIVANEIICEDMNSPGLVTWQHNSLVDQEPSSGQAATGYHGIKDGNPGGVGHQGIKGNKGYNGKNAPNITIFVLDVPSSGPEINFRGQDGGKGGKGQKGGDGGNGGKGVPASQNCCDCTDGAGDGGNGGNGGPGGPGGNGGDGGNGGIITIISKEQLLPSLEQKMRTIVSGGTGGPGGDGGEGGNPGLGGPGGQEALPWCRGNGNRGNDGARGENGPMGETGTNGVDGDIFHGSMTEEEIENIFNIDPMPLIRSLGRNLRNNDIEFNQPKSK